LRNIPGSLQYLVKKSPVPTLSDTEAWLTRYWARFLSLPKTIPVHTVWRLEYDMSERLASGKCKILDKIQMVDGHKCLLIDCGPEFVWLDCDALVVRRTARKRGGKPSSGNSFHMSDYRPLPGTLLSIPWRVEMRYGTTVWYYTVTRALANKAVSLRP